jgi:cyanophycin synthetase
MDDRYCPDCEESKSIHIIHWIGGALEKLPIPQGNLPSWFEGWCTKALMRALTTTGFGEFRSTFDMTDMQPRVAFFIAAARRRGIECAVLYLGKRATEHLRLRYEGREYYLQGYPTATHVNGALANAVDNKAKTKKYLQAGGFPAAPGKAYYFWQKEFALRDAIQSIGFPLVVKPVSGTFGRHVTVNIRTEHALRTAIAHACRYQPSFLIESYLEGAQLYRVTVVDFDFVAALRYEHAHVRGDGLSSIRQLIDQENANPLRTPHAATYPLFWPLLIDETTNAILQEAGLTFDSVPHPGDVIRLQRGLFLRYGTDLIDVTSAMHEDNKRLFIDVLRHFDLRCGGLDVILEDIARPWREQRGGILEINSFPCIDMHHAPTSGTPRDVAAALVDLFFKYYVKPRSATSSDKAI